MPNSYKYINCVYDIKDEYPVGNMINNTKRHDEENMNTIAGVKRVDKGLKDVPKQPGVLHVQRNQGIALGYDGAQ